MTFQFLCPQGHLLEADETQMGQQLDCPLCQSTFIVPTAPASAPSVQDAAPAANPFDFSRGFAPPAEAAEAPFPDVTGAPEATAHPFEPAADAGPRLLHIPCPSGHELESPEDMLGQDVLCPLCGQQFQLRYKDSLEAKRERELDEERRDQKLAKVWFQRAVVVAVVVVLGVILMIAVTATSN